METVVETEDMKFLIDVSKLTGSARGPTLESDAQSRQILMSKVDPRNERIKKNIMVLNP